MTNLSYSCVVIIFNPISTSGRAEVKAERLAERLRKKGVKKISVVASDYPGHAEILAYETTVKHPRPLIISASGDGGYNEVVNGIMRAQKEYPKHQPTCAILAAGNSNDHRRSVRKHPLSWAITHRDSEPLSILKLTITLDGHTRQRYAHSYIGLGVSGQAAKLINQETYTRWQDLGIVLKTLFFFKPVSVIDDDGKKRRYDSLVFLLSKHMSRVFRVAPKPGLNSPSFRVVGFRHQARWKLLFTMAYLLVMGVKSPPKAQSYSLVVEQDTTLQIDGEYTEVPAGSKVQLDSVVDAVLTLR